MTVSDVELRTVAGAQQGAVTDRVDLASSVWAHPHEALVGALGGLGDDEVRAVDHGPAAHRDISGLDRCRAGVDVIGVLVGVATGDRSGSGQGSDAASSTQDLASSGGHGLSFVLSGCRGCRWRRRRRREPYLLR